MKDVLSDAINLDGRLAQSNLDQLEGAAGGRIMVSGPFYNCFFNRFIGVDETGDQEQ
jgi:hypothetical protein